MADTFEDAFFEVDIRDKSECSQFMEQFQAAKGKLGYPNTPVYHLPLTMRLQGPNPEFYDSGKHLVKLSE